MFWGLLNSTPELCERLRLGLRVKPCVSGAHSVTLNPSLAAPVERAHAVTLNPSLAAPVELLILCFILSLYHSSLCLSTPVPAGPSAVVVEPEAQSGKLHHFVSVSFNH